MTSGTYRHYFAVGDRTYSHILDPGTGRPVEHELLAVTVLARDPAVAAAWGTALLCLGPQRGASTAEAHSVAALFSVRNGAAVESIRTTGLARDWPGTLE